jgi:hypothetical protein
VANKPYERKPGKGKFAYVGVDLKNPPDLMPMGRAPYMLNVSPDQNTGAMNCRAGLQNIGSVAGVPHSVKRLNNPLPGAAVPWTRFIGSGTNLYSGQTSFPLLDSGFSGNPLSLVTYRPPLSPEAWLYAYDSAKQRKYRTNGTINNIGIMPPASEPVAGLAAPNIKAILDVGGVGSFVGSGYAATPTAPARLPSPTTVSSILIDSGNRQWACIVPANSTSNYSALTAGSRVIIASELCTIKQVFGGMTATTIAGIAYDSGTSGMATVVPTIPVQGLQRNMLVYIGSTANPVRVLSVNAGQDGLYSFRCVLGAGIVAGASISIPASFRVFLNATTHVVGETISSQVLSSVMTVPGTVTSGTGLVSSPLAMDISQVGSVGYGGNRPLTTDDYMHVSLSVDQPGNVSELHILLDVDSTTNDFAHNYYYYVIRQSDFQQSAAGLQTTTTSNLTALTNSLANSNSVLGNQSFLGVGQLPYPAAQTGAFTTAPSADQLSVGNSQWFEAIFKINDLTRVGDDQSVNLSNIKAVGILAILTATATVSFGSWWVGGTFGPDCNYNSYGNQGQPIIYRYRYRSSTNGARSDVSPATRNGELPAREAVNLSVVASPDAQCDVIDIERNGGTGDTWHRFWTVPNATATYMDTVLETVAQAGDPLELLSYAPWPITDKPRVGVCNIIGSRVTWVSGDTFNLKWIRGVEFIVNNQTYTLYAPPDTTTTLQLTENVGVFPGVSFVIPEATIIGSPLPYVCLGMDGRNFATGDLNNPGFLYFSESYNPDSASDRGYIEITSPSDPLGPPVYFEGAIYVHSSSDLYRVDSTPSSPNLYSYYKLSGMSGLSATWALSGDGPILAWVGSDGIYSYSSQGAAGNITAADLYPLFPFESRPGLASAVNGYVLFGPNYTFPSALRLSWANGFLLFDYQDSVGNQCTFAYHAITQGWIPYQYTPGIVLHYQEEGVQNPVTIALGKDGSVNMLSNQQSDNGVGFPCVVVTPADDQGETRARKQYGDLSMDYLGFIGPSLAVYYDNFLLASITDVLAASSTRTIIPVDLGIDAATLHHNIGLAVSWLSTNDVTLYEWQPSYLAEPEDSLNRPTDWMDAGTMHYKFVHGCRITADTQGVARTVQVQYDGGIIGPTLTVIHSGEVVMPYSWVPFKAHLMRLVPTDGQSWRLMNVEWEVDIEPESTNYWITQPTSFGLPGYLHLRDCQIAYASLNAAVLVMIVDGVSYNLAALIGNSANETKQYFSSPPAKGKIWQLYGTGTGLQIYQQDCEFRVKQWGGGPYNVLKPWGDLNFTSGGAKI